MSIITLEVAGVAFSFLMISFGCLANDGPAMPSARSAHSATWHYQLQNLDLQGLASTSYDLLVIDYSSDGAVKGEFAPQEIGALRASGKTVLAYLSIGEAESYRFYWNRGWRPGQPSWLLGSNPDYPDNYLVAYWNPAWQGIVRGYLEKIVAQGFSGIYLDRVDAYESFEETRPQAAREMLDFIESLATYARNDLRKSDFSVFIQNGEELARFPELMRPISGIAREDTYCVPGKGLRNPAETSQIERWLDQYLASGKVVLTVDYCGNPSQVEKAYKRAQAKGYRPFFTTQNLDTLISQTRP